MRRAFIVLSLLALGVAACSKSPSTGVMELPRNPSPPPAPGGVGAASVGGGRMGRGGIAATVPSPEGEGGREAATNVPAPILGPDNRARYEAALTQGIERIAEKKWEEALAAFEAAQRIQRNDLTSATIERLTRRRDEEKTAGQTADNIQTVLDEGKPEDAARLAGEALLDFGNTDAVARLLKLKRQADALAVVGVEDRKARFQRFHDEYEAAKEKNKRAALVALEQALQNGDDEALKTKYEALATELQRYDDLRERATELRREPERLEEAVAALKEAADIWSNATVLQELEEYRVALQLRRPRLAVLDFEERGDVGVPGAGAFVAEALVPEFKSSHSVVERSQIGKLIEELRKQGDASDDEAARRALERTTSARYLVVGSVTPIAGLTVRARLVDVQSGLVVQTARVSAPTAEKLTEVLPQLAQDLLMSDEQKNVAEQRRAAEVEPVKPADLTNPLPPPDPPAPDAPLPAPVIPAWPKPPAAADLKPEQLDVLPPAPPAGQAAVLSVLSAERELELRRRSLFVALELGDNLFRRGRFREAFGYFEFAFTLFPDHRDVRLRVDRCRPLLPPPATVVVRPRVAVLDFLVVGDVNQIPPYLGTWTPDHLAPYLAPELAVADRQVLDWWMGRLGLTIADLVNDPVARVYLSRALGVRYFLFGSVVQTASFNVTTYLVDAEYGFLASSARIHVRSPAELTVRLAELAWLTKLAPEQRRRVENDNAQWALLMSDIRAAERLGRYDDVIGRCQRGLQLRPGNVELLELQGKAARDKRDAEFKKAHDVEVARLAKLHQQTSLRQEERNKQAHEAARERIEVTAAAERARRDAQRRAAAEDMVRRAKLMIQTKRFSVAVQLYESAVALRPGDDSVYRELALARAKAEETARAEVAEAQARREGELRRKREEELAATRVMLDAERKRREADDAARRKAIDERDRQEAERLMGLAQQLSAKQQYDQAVAAAQKAKQLRPTPEAERLLSQLLVELAKSNAEKRGAAAKAELERQLAAEREARVTAEAEAERNRKLYESLVTQGQKFLTQDKFDEAQEQFLKARKIHETDVVLTGLNQAKAGKARLEAKFAEEQRRSAELQGQNDALRAKLAEAQAALTARQLDKAVALFREAKRIAPTNVDALTGLAKAEQARDQERAMARRDDEGKAKLDTFKRFLESGKAHLAGQRYEAAVAALSEAARLVPDDKEAKARLAEAESKRSAGATARAELKKKTDDYQAKMREGQRYMAAKRYEQAAQAFNEAKNLVPGDQAAAQFAQEAERAIDAEYQAKQQAARKAADAAAKLSQQKDKVRELVQQAREALKAKKLDDAGKLLDRADELSPRNAAVAQARTELTRLRDETAALQKRQEFNRLMTEGRTALQAKKYADAVKAFQSAVALFPQDAAAAQALAEAKKGPPAAPPMPPAKPPATPTPPAYMRQMDQGALQEKAGRYEQALAAYKAALQALPTDVDAKAKVDFCQAMIDADKAMKARKFAEARVAYETALKLFPNDANAKAGLQRAKTGK